jgi:peptide/nickel transport system permease protein
VADAQAKERFRTARAFARNPLGVAGLAFVLITSGCVVLAAQLAPYDPKAQDYSTVLSGPISAHPLGTDQLGRDILSRLLFGGRLTLLGVFEAVAVAFLIGVVLGLIAGFAGGQVDNLISRTADIVMAIPAIVILLMIYAITSNNPHYGMLALGLLSVPGICRVTRTATLAAKSETFIDVTRVIGMGRARIIFGHVLPNIWGPIIVNTSILAALTLGIQGGLNYLNLGVTPPDPSWGGMVSEAQQSLQLQPWLIVPSGLTLALTIMAFILIADAMRDATAAAGARSERPARRRKAAQPAGPVSERTAGPAVTAPGPVDGAASALLAVRSLSVAFGGQRVVQDVNLTVDTGETLGIVGESGCGKTVTASAILGSLGRTARVSGDVSFLGQNLLGVGRKARAQVRGKGIAYVSQDPMVALDPCFSVGSHLGEVVGRHDGLRAGARRARVSELLTMVGLPNPDDVAKKFPHELSGGMAQRVLIALALAGRPKLLIADEITTALDVTIQAEILDLLRSLRDETGMAMILITHDLGVVADICDRAAVMYAGQVVETAAAATVFLAPAHPYTQALIAANPIVAERGRPLASIPGSVPPPAQWPASCHFADRCLRVEPVCRSGPVAMSQAAGPGQTARCVLLNAGAEAFPVGLERPAKEGP